MYINRKYFSSKKEDITSDGKAGLIAVGSGAGLVTSADPLSRKTNKIGVKYHQLREGNRSRHEQDIARKLTDKIRKSGIGFEVASDGGYYSPGRNAIVVTPDAPVSTIAHELGHAHYRQGPSKNIIAKAAHKGTWISKKISRSRNSDIGVLVNGVHSGMVKERNKAKGKKTNAFDKYKSVALPLAITSPVLIAEGAASVKGLRILKGLGANKELLRKAAKQNSIAYGTYLSNHPLRLTATGVGGELIGRGIGKIAKYDKNKDK